MNIQQLQTAFNITWEPPSVSPSPPVSYIIHYKLTSEKQAKEVVLPATNNHFILSTWPHYGKEYEIGVAASFATFKGATSGPFIQRSSKIILMLSESCSNFYLSIYLYTGIYTEYNPYVFYRKIILDVNELFESQEIIYGLKSELSNYIY